MDGYILEIDLEYPDYLHELHNDYSLAPEKLETSQDVFKNYCSSFPNKYDIKIGSVSKLFSNLLYESNYVLHYKHLLMYLLLRMKLVSDHIILKLIE